MKLLLDTQVLLWAAAQPSRLSKTARKLLLNQEHELWFSAANIWEVAIKNSLGRKDFQVDSRALRRMLLENEYAELAITGEHMVSLDVLPDIHKDPFDRILVAQALVEGFALMTADPILSKYPGSICLV